MKKNVSSLIFVYIGAIILGILAFVILKSPFPWYQRIPIGDFRPTENEVSQTPPVEGGMTGGIDSTSEVPFTPQAPHANWDDIVYQEGREEASILMAIYWAKGENLTESIANDKIKNISDFEQELLSVFRDTSISDTAEVMGRYFSFENYRVEENISLSDIFTELRNGNILIVPAYGRDLHNIYYTPPGPVAHMLVITGYDEVQQQFITNDPGTQHGKGYRYDRDSLFDAIWTYPTTQDTTTPPVSGEKRNKSMIVVSKGL